MSYSKVENKKIRKRDINSENFSFKKSQDSVSCDSSPTVNPIKLLGWANETLHKLKVDRNHLQKTKKKKENNRNLSSHKSKSKNTTVEPSSPIKESTLTYISEVVTQSKKKRRKIKCVEVDNGVSRTENLSHPPKNMTHRHNSKDSYDKTDSVMGLKQRFGKISWSDGREDIIYEHEVIPKKKKKRKKCEHGELIILNANVCVPEKEKKNKKEKKHKSVYISKDTDSAIKRAKFENSGDLILYNDSESVLEKKKKKKKKELTSLDGINSLDGTYITQLKTKNPLDISKDSPTHIRDKCENNELILLNGSESVPRKKNKNKDKELKSSENAHQVNPSINGKSALDIKRKYKDFDECVDRSVDSESYLGKRKKYKHYENIDGTINESSATKKKEKAIQVSDIIDESISKKERKKKLKGSCTYNETEEPLEKPKKKKHKEANTLNVSVEGSEKSRDMGENKNKLCKDSDMSYEVGSFEHKRKQKVKCQDGLDEKGYVNKKSKRHDSGSGEIPTEKHKDEGECSPEHRKRKGRHLEGDNVDLVETYEYIPKKKKKKRKLTEEIDINIRVHEEERVKKKKKKEKESDSVVSQESREKNDKTEDSETSCVSNGHIQQSVKKKHKKKHKDASETDFMDGFEQEETLEPSTVLVEEKHKHEKKTDRNDDNDVEYQTTFVLPTLKVRKKSTEQTYKFGPSPIFRLLMTDSDDEHSCKTCQKCRNSSSNSDASVSKRSDNVVNMYDFSDVVVKTEPGIVIKKEIIEEESAPDIEGPETANVQTSLTMEESTNCASITGNVNGTDVSINIDISNVTVKEEPLSPVHDGLPNAHPFESSVTQTEMIVSNEVNIGESREGSSITDANKLNYEAQLETSSYQNIYDDKLTIKDELVDFNSENMFENVGYSNTGNAENTSTLLESSDLPQTQIISVVDPHLVSTDSNKQTVNDPHLDNVIMDSNKQTNTVARDVKNSKDFSFIDEFISINISNAEGNAEAGESNVTGNELVNQQGNRYFPPLNIDFPDNRPLPQRIAGNLYVLHFTQVPKKFSRASCSKLLKVPVGDIRVNPNYYDYRWCQNYITVKFNNERSLQRVLKCHVRKVKCSSWFVNTIPVWR